MKRSADKHFFRHESPIDGPLEHEHTAQVESPHDVANRVGGEEWRCQGHLDCCANYKLLDGSHDSLQRPKLEQVLKQNAK